jgi:hypothetical protein
MTTCERHSAIMCEHWQAMLGERAMTSLGSGCERAEIT